MEAGNLLKMRVLLNLFVSRGSKEVLNKRWGQREAGRSIYVSAALSQRPRDGDICGAA